MVPMHMAIGFDLGLAIGESCFSQPPVRRVIRPGRGAPLANTQCVSVRTSLSWATSVPVGVPLRATAAWIVG